MYPHPHRPFSRGANNRFARMLVVVMPGSLLLTWLWKQHEMLTPRENDWPASEPDAVDIRRVVYRAPPEPQCDGEERAILRRLGWWNASSTDNCCRWRGVRCSDGRVSGLKLSGGKLRGTISSELADLSQLEVVDLNENPGLSGTLPAQLTRLGALTHVYLFGSTVSGSIPDLGGCASLQELELSHCRLSGTLPASLGRASKLQFLFLEANALSGTLPTALSRLRRLKELELSENKLSGSVPASLRAMPLQHLDVQQNPRLSGAAETRASSQTECNGGAAKYLRGSGGPPRQQSAAVYTKSGVVPAGGEVSSSS
jgi:hypothetical protein